MIKNWINKIFGIKTKMVKVAFLPNGGHSSIALERLWATPQGNGTYLLENSSFDYYGVSYKDIVSAEQRDGDLMFTGVVKRSGHSTFRVRLHKGEHHSAFMKHWRELKDLGCTFEGCAGDNRQLYSIDVPPHTSTNKVFQILSDLESKGIWEFEEAHIYRQD